MEDSQGNGRRWFEYDQDSRIKEIYSKFTIQQFWDFWSNYSNRYMEVRIKDINIIKEVAERYNLHYSSSGVYVNTYDKLKYVIAYCRDKTIMWMGVQPRRMTLNYFGNKVFEGKDVNVDEIAFIFIDIDRVSKNGPSAIEDLKNADIMADEIIKKMNNFGMAKSYCKICSGNGVQLLIKLDIAIKMPLLDYETKTAKSKEGKSYQIYLLKNNYEFEKIKSLFTVGLKQQILGFANRKLKNHLGVFVDSGAFKLMQVSALPFTKNYKYDSFTWRGIIELKNDEPNEGLADYILAIKCHSLRENSVFTRRPKAIDPRHTLKLKAIREHVVSRLFLDYQLPYGNINNILWCQFKCLVRDFKINMKSPYFIDFVKEIEEKYKGKFTMNLPANNIEFSEDVINDYCLENGIPIPYTYLSSRIKESGLMLKEFCLDDRKEYEFSEIIDYDGNNIKEDMRLCKSKMRKGDYSNKKVFGEFLNAMVKKYGENKVNFWWNQNIITRFFNYD